MRLPKFRLFDYTTPGPGVDKNAAPKTGPALFGDILSRRFWKMVTLNLLYFVFSIPSLIILYFISYGVLALIFGSYMVSDSTMAQTVSSMAAYLAVFVVSLFGSGAPASAMTYIIQNYVRDKHSWVWADFISCYKSLFFKSAAIFVTDTVLVSLMCINFWFYGSFAGENIAAYLLQGLMVVVLLIFLLMHSYIYPILASYKNTKIFNIYKSAFIIAVGKLPQTFFSTLLCAALSGLICFLACFVTVYAMLIIPIILFTFVSFVNSFITDSVMTKYLGESL